MKKEHFFPVEVNIMNDERVAHLINRHGPKGLGVYFSLLIELRQHKNYRFGINAVLAFSRIIRVEKKFIMSVIEDFNLFECSGEGEDRQYSSPYIDRVMAKYDEKIRNYAIAGKKKAELSKRNSNGQFTANAGVKENKRKENTTTVVVEENRISNSNNDQYYHSNEHNEHSFQKHKALKPLQNWEEYLNQAVQDKPWMEILGFTSGMGKYFLNYHPDIIETFRKHIQLHGTGGGIQSERDIKSYFANYLRPGTATHKQVLQGLVDKEKKERKESCYQFETVDPTTGARSYYGNSIPPDAPPRPDDNVAWSHELKKWL